MVTGVSFSLLVRASLRCTGRGRVGYGCTQLWAASRQQQRSASGHSRKLFDKESLEKLSPGFRNQDLRDGVYLAPKAKDEGYEKLPIMHIRATFNNTIFTITDHDGRVLAWTSAGVEGFHNAKRGTTFAAQTAAIAAAKKALNLGLKKFRVKIKGPGPGRQPSLKGLEAGGLSVVSLQDVTPIPHNGCKPRKARRL